MTDEPGTSGQGRGRLLRLLARAADPRVRFAILVVVLGTGLAVLVVAGGPSRAAIEATVRDAGLLGPVVYVLLYAVLVVALVPASVVTAVGGVLFGSLAGTALTVVGATLGAVAGFGLGRVLGREQVEALAGDRVARLDAWLSRRGLVAVLYLRLVPVVPFSLSNYVLGVTAVGARDFTVATLVGIVPGTFAYATLGGNIDDPTSPAFLFACGLLVVLAVGGPLVDRRVRRRGTSAPDPGSTTASPPTVEEPTP